MKYRSTVSEIPLAASDSRTFYSKDGYCVFLFTAGECVVEWDDRRLICGQEDIALMQPARRMTLCAVNPLRSARALWLWLDKGDLVALSDARTDLARSFQIVPFGCTVVRAPAREAMTVRNIAQRLCAERRAERFGNDILLRGMLSVLLISILRICIAAEFKARPIKRAPFSLDGIFVYLRDHISEDVSLQKLEQVFFISHEHIAREFKKQTGRTLHGYVLSMRLEKSCRMLRENQPVTSVWRSCGFNSYSYFFQAFKKHYGVTPKTYANSASAAGLTS